jgi:hypothetical protein
VFNAYFKSATPRTLGNCSDTRVTRVAETARGNGRQDLASAVLLYPSSHGPAMTMEKLKIKKKINKTHTKAIIRRPLTAEARVCARFSPHQI